MAARLFDILNPISSTRTRAAVLRYKVEPYVVAADVYSNPDHRGRGGWTWYTGSAGWMQRAGVEGILGLTIHGRYSSGRSLYSEELARLCNHAPASIRDVSDRGQKSGWSELRGGLGKSRRGAVAARPVMAEMVDDGKTHILNITLG